MRSVKRREGFVPDGLDDAKTKELAAARAYFALSPAARKNVEKVDFKAYKLASVKAELEKLFDGKCAYCESFYSSTAPVDIEHYRPKGEVQEVEHDGYWWLAAEWSNLLPSCIDCNRKRKQRTPKPGASLLAMVEDGSGTQITSTGKKDSFPIADEAKRATGEASDLSGEAPLLLDPCRDDPGAHIDFNYDPAIGAAIVFPSSTDGTRILGPAGERVTAADAAANAAANMVEVRGAVSIHVYGLNRLGLVQARTRVVRQLEFLAGLLVDLDALGRDVEKSGAGAQIKARVTATTASLQDRILQEMRAMADPRSEYSATAAAWLRRFTEELAS